MKKMEDLGSRFEDDNKAWKALRYFVPGAATYHLAKHFKTKIDRKRLENEQEEPILSRALYGGSYFASGLGAFTIEAATIAGPIAMVSYLGRFGLSEIIITAGIELVLRNEIFQISNDEDAKKIRELNRLGFNTRKEKKNEESYFPKGVKNPYRMIEF